MATATSSSRRWSCEIDYDDSRSRSLHQRWCHIRCAANDDAGRGGNGSATTSNEYEATAAMDIMVRRAAADSTPTSECGNGGQTI